MTASQSFAVAFVGAGAMAREHVRAFADVPGVELAGIHSRTRSRAERLADDLSIAAVFDSVAELYDGTHADVVVVTVPVGSMKDVAIECLAHPWTVLLEKPPGLSPTEAEEIAAAAAGRERAALIALNRRFLSSTRAVLDDIARDDAPRYIRVQDAQSLEEARALGYSEDVVRRWMYANSIHLVDYLSLLGRGAVESVEVALPWKPDARVVLATVRFASGDAGVYEGIWNGPGPWAVTLVTQAKRWELRPLEQAALQRRGARALETVPLHEWDTRFKPGLRLMAEHVVAAMRGEPSDIPTVGDSLKTMRLIEAIFGE